MLNFQKLYQQCSLIRSENWELEEYIHIHSSIYSINISTIDVAEMRFIYVTYINVTYIKHI